MSLTRGFQTPFAGLRAGMPFIGKGTPASETVPCHTVRKVDLPAGVSHELRLTVSGDPYEHPGKSDFVMAVGVHDGQSMNWFPTETINPGSHPGEENWDTRTYDLRPHAGKTVCLVVKVAYGGPLGVCNEFTGSL